MKKKICFIILLIFAGYVFFTGWTQIKVKPEFCGIVQSKLSGIKDSPIVSGKFSWNWDFLIPGNAKITTFSIKPFNYEKSISGTVASGDAFSSSDLLGYKFNYTLTLSYTPEAIISLMKKNYISNQEDFETYMSNAADYLCQSATTYYLKRVQTDPNFKPENIKRDDIIKVINSYKEFPDIDVVLISLVDYKLPNYALYNKLITNNFHLSISDNQKN